ncbi:hypothetical protein DOTSEDRAFT_85500 [Dothistroma septosporum NZE10]|uniref:Acyl-CoA dehydrogenase/oxidase C-terminal domain-containing protein n=1 Tax=Dothistroma septosporum (strain NZE10 / CBS 128990) TaxID=675120 RepID=N1Q4L4_DOTSN|nr:hypothetical protein DOTSEDRAFT_85500 [Dothistroma septosporum NZE10]
MTEAKHNFPASSGINGFFQEPPILSSAIEDDEALKRVRGFYLPNSVQQEITPDLRRFSTLVTTPQIRDWCADAEKNVPYVRHWDSWGRRIDELITAEGWKNLQSLGFREGIVAIGHEATYGQHSRVYQFLKYHIWSPWCAYVTCPSAMTDGAARLLELQLVKGELGEVEGKVFRIAHDHLTSREIGKAWTSGQWMTERPGGSDVQNTETQAITCTESLGQSVTDIDGNPLGPISINGFKWFSSATDANTTVLLAREVPSGGISAFFAPTRRLSTSSSDLKSSSLNGISIQRLKSKLGTRALPTAELVLSDMRAWRIGKPGQGTKEISTVLNITRVHNSVTAVGLWGRGLAISRAFSRVRAARGRLLIDTPAHVRILAEQHVEYRAMMHLTFYTVALLGASERSGPSNVKEQSLYEAAALAPKHAIPYLLRLLTPLAKMLTAKASIAGLAECMESLGGVGYLENEDISMNIARLYRDANVLSIWEGTTNIMADDVVRIVKGSSGVAVLQALDEVIAPNLAVWSKKGRTQWSEALTERWSSLKATIQSGSKESLSLNGRHLASEFGWIICALLLAADALSDANTAAFSICDRWILRRGSSPAVHYVGQDEVTQDREIVFGASPWL